MIGTYIHSFAHSLTHSARPPHTTIEFLQTPTNQATPLVKTHPIPPSLTHAKKKLLHASQLAKPARTNKHIFLPKVQTPTQNFFSATTPLFNFHDHPSPPHYSSLHKPPPAKKMDE
ncbi:hypothetical protein BDD12DRAFT_559549 [Trichophaea hybrida]|nr:hypothetical protein BDD12DRAFT_559549 [Trichophaea hybrida]